MREVHGCEVVDFDLGAQDFDRGLEEEAWVGFAGVGPDYVRGIAGIPGRCFGDYALVLGRGGEVGGDVVEALGRRRGGGLCSVKPEHVGVGQHVTRTLSVSKAVSSFWTLRATITTFAPRFASSLARPSPRP